MTIPTRGAARTALDSTGSGVARRPRRRYRAPLGCGILACWVLACTGTGPGDTGSLPPSVQDPTIVKTPVGALGFYRAVVASLAPPLGGLVANLGLITDELASLPSRVGVSGEYTAADSRQKFDDELLGAPYNALNKIRGQAQEARGFVRTYLTDSSSALLGHLFAMEGYADVLLADVFCSGIPLSTIDFGADYTLAAGSTTAEVYTAAAALFDSALALTGDSARLHDFAAVGMARALLALGQYDGAAAAVAAVPTSFRYEVVQQGDLSPLALFLLAFQSGQSYGAPSMGDGEGQNGLDYRSSGDPRVLVFTPDGQDPLGYRMAFPAKYPTSGPTTYVVADGIEARLIEAEAALAAGGDWLAIVNALRTDGTYDTQPNADDPSTTDTLWHAGTGGVPGLRPLVDPGDKNGRVDLLFRERAFWLYLTAHRQGDLRRLIRQYQRAPETVYPTGSYPGGSGRYGTEITVPVPATEAQYNPNYTGCFHHNA